MSVVIMGLFWDPVVTFLKLFLFIYLNFSIFFLWNLKKNQQQRYILELEHKVKAQVFWSFQIPSALFFEIWGQLVSIRRNSQNFQNSGYFKHTSTNHNTLY